MSKYIVIGLGNFGASLAEKLTQEGNEVIGVDASMTKVESMKDKVSHVIRLDATDQYTVSGLPIGDTDAVIVAIGEDQGANIMATAIMKNLKARRLISRAITKLHESVLQAIGVDEIVHPEEETAERWAKKLCLKGLVDSFELAGEFSIVEVAVPGLLTALSWMAHSAMLATSSLRPMMVCARMSSIACFATTPGPPMKRPGVCASGLPFWPKRNGPQKQNASALQPKKQNSRQC